MRKGIKMKDCKLYLKSARRGLACLIILLLINFLMRFENIENYVRESYLFIYFLAVLLCGIFGLKYLAPYMQCISDNYKKNRRKY